MEETPEFAVLEYKAEENMFMFMSKIVFKENTLFVLRRKKNEMKEMLFIMLEVH